MISEYNCILSSVVKLTCSSSNIELVTETWKRQITVIDRHLALFRYKNRKRKTLALYFKRLKPK